jgi:hypothetical protein
MLLGRVVSVRPSSSCHEIVQLLKIIRSTRIANLPLNLRGLKCTCQRRLGHMSEAPWTDSSTSCW